MRKIFIIMLLFLFAAHTQATCCPEYSGTDAVETPEKIQKNKNSTKMKITVNGTMLEVELVDNVATRALVERLQESNITYTSSSYGNFESVGNIGFSLPTSNTNLTTQAGDVVLYQGNQICIFYGSNTWSYTRIGKVVNASQAEIRNLLEIGTVSVTLSLVDLNTGVANITTDNAIYKTGIYSLDGKRLQQVPQSGVYIENGVKKIAITH